MAELTNPADVQQFVRAAGTPRTLGPSRFDTQPATSSDRTRIARYRAEALLAVIEGREHPFKIAIPAYEQFETDGMADNTETFSLSHDLIECPTTDDVVVWIGGDYYGRPDSVDHAADEIDVTDSGSNNTVHVWYIAGEGATLEVRKAAPSSSTKASQELYEENLALIHPTNQGDQPESFTLNDTPLQDMVGTDQTLDVYVSAPYTVRWEDPDGDGAEPTNALLNVPTYETGRSIESLPSIIKRDMAQA